MLSAVAATSVGFGYPVPDSQQGADVKPLPSDLPTTNNIPFMNKEEDVIACEAELPDGIHPVYINSAIGRCIEGKYTHSAISIVYSMRYKGLDEPNVNSIISGGGVGCLYIKDHKIQSLTLRPHSIRTLEDKMDVKEVMLRIGSIYKAIDHPVRFRPTKSEEQYQTYCLKLVSNLKSKGLLL